jgi:hypothetical protein
MVLLHQQYNVVFHTYFALIYRKYILLLEKYTHENSICMKYAFLSHLLLYPGLKDILQVYPGYRK